VDTVFSSLPQFLLACLVLVGAEAVYVLLGFGAGLIAVGTLALFMPELRDVVVLLLLVNLPAEAWVVISSRRHIAWRGVLLVMVGVAAGIPLGTWLLSAGDPGVLLTLLGAVLAVIGGVFLLTPTAPATDPGLDRAAGRPALRRAHRSVRHRRPAAHLLPPAPGDQQDDLPGNLMAIFLLMTAVRVPSYAAFGLITAPRIWSSLAVLPAVLLGAFLGDRVHLRIAEASFRRLVSIALVIIGVVLLARSW